MPRKPNYGFERAERNRTKAMKKAERLRAKAEKSAARKSDSDEAESSDDPPSLTSEA